MPRRIIRQPNGKFACFSSVVDHFIWYGATEEQARDALREEYIKEVEERINNVMRGAIEDWPPYTRGVAGKGTERWDHDAYTALAIHSDDQELVEILLNCGMTNEQIEEWKEEIRKENESWQTILNND